MSVGNKLLQAAAGNAGGEAVYVDDLFSTFIYEGNGAFAKVIENNIALVDGPANGTVLHLTGDNLTDSSPVAKTVTNNNSVSVSTSVKKYGTGSLQFDGVDQYLSIASSSSSELKQPTRVEKSIIPIKVLAISLLLFIFRSS